MSTLAATDPQETSMVTGVASSLRSREHRPYWLGRDDKSEAAETAAVIETLEALAMAKASKHAHLPQPLALARVRHCVMTTASACGASALDVGLVRSVVHRGFKLGRAMASKRLGRQAIDIALGDAAGGIEYVASGAKASDAAANDSTDVAVLMECVQQRAQHLMAGQADHAATDARVSGMYAQTAAACAKCRADDDDWNNFLLYRLHTNPHSSAGVLTDARVKMHLLRIGMASSTAGLSISTSSGSVTVNGKAADVVAGLTSILTGASVERGAASSVLRAGVAAAALFIAAQPWGTAISSMDVKQAACTSALATALVRSTEAAIMLDPGSRIVQALLLHLDTAATPPLPTVPPTLHRLLQVLRTRQPTGAALVRAAVAAARDAATAADDATAALLATVLSVTARHLCASNAAGQLLPSDADADAVDRVVCAAVITAVHDAIAHVAIDMQQRRSSLVTRVINTTGHDGDDGDVDEDAKGNPDALQLVHVYHRAVRRLEQLVNAPAAVAADMARSLRRMVTTADAALTRRVTTALRIPAHVMSAVHAMHGNSVPRSINTSDVAAASRHLFVYMLEHTPMINKTICVAENALDQPVSVTALESSVRKTIIKALKHTVEAPGKRVRPMLVLMAADMFGLTHEQVAPLVKAVEWMHVASLILDDLPIQDNADQRRGKPTSHLIAGEAGAQMASIALLCMASQCNQQMAETFNVPQLLGYTSWALQEACVGQTMDLASDGRPEAQRTVILTEPVAPADTAETLAWLERMCALKTGLGFQVPLLSVAMCAGVDANVLDSLRVYADATGLAFQIRDDLLDEAGADTGKPSCIDEANGRATFVTVLGHEQAEAELRRHQAVALEALAGIPGDTHLLEQLVDYVATRSK